MSHYIAVDIGGTQLRAALYPADSLEPIRLERTSTQALESSDSCTDPLERLKNLIASLWPSAEPVAAISVAAPGPVDPYRGVLLEAPNIPGWEDMPLKECLEQRFHVPVVLGNDANLAALGEWQFGAGRGHSHMIYITISTGIGGGIIVDNRLLLGKQGLAAEIGHVTVLPDGPLCGCGQRGHLEALASGTAIANWIQGELQNGAHSSLPSDQPITARMVSDAAQAGDKLCISALARAGYFMGMALANLLHTFNPSAVILGGGVSKSGALLLDPLHASLSKHIMNPHFLDGLTLATAAFGDEVGLVGALALGRTSYPSK